MRVYHTADMGKAHRSMTMMADCLNVGGAALVTTSSWRVTGNLNTHDNIPNVLIVVFQIVRAARYEEHSFPELSVCC